jgi:DnaJ-class molecular chaperone
MSEGTFYAILGVAATASIGEIKRAYRHLARQCHPDLHPGDGAAEARFKAIAAAVEVLTDSDLRAAYDTQLAIAQRPAIAAPGDERYIGYDVHYEITVTAAEAAHGTLSVLQFHTSDGQPYQIGIEIPAGTRTGTRFRLAGYGGPALYSSRRGDLYVTITLVEEHVA